jgi:hypothetical protein
VTTRCGDRTARGRPARGDDLESLDDDQGLARFDSGSGIRRNYRISSFSRPLTAIAFVQFSMGRSCPQKEETEQSGRPVEWRPSTPASAATEATSARALLPKVRPSSSWLCCIRPRESRLRRRDRPLTSTPSRSLGALRAQCRPAGCRSRFGSAATALSSTAARSVFLAARFPATAKTRHEEERGA